MTVAYPPAHLHLLPEADRQPLIIPTQGILHSVVGDPDPFGYFAKPEVVAESHLWIDQQPSAAHPSGLEQYVSLHRSADANRRANRRPDGTGAVSVETSDTRHPDSEPWSPFQLDAIVALMVWCADPDGLVATFLSVTGQVIAPIPLVRCPTSSAPGWGYHTMWGAPSDWTPVVKTCPGAARIAQFPAMLDQAQQVRAAMHYPPPATPPSPSGEHVYLVRNIATQAIHVCAERTGIGSALPTMEAVGELEAQGIVSKAPNGGRWADLSPDAFAALPGA